MHVMNNVDRIHIQLCHIRKHLFIICQNLRIVQNLIGIPFNVRNHLNSFLLVDSAVDGIEQALCQVCPCPEELHLLSHSHGRYTACDAIIIAIERPHNIVIFILDGIRINTHLRTVLFKCLRQILAPQHRQIRFRRGSQIGQGMQITEGIFRYQRPTVYTHSA